MLVGPTINTFLGHLPLSGELAIVQKDHLLNRVHHNLELLAVLLILQINMSNLYHMGPPLSFHIVHL